MANETQVAESVIVKMVGDLSSYVAMLGEAVMQTKQAAAKIGNDLNSVAKNTASTVTQTSQVAEHLAEANLSKIGQRAVGTGLLIAGLARDMVQSFKQFATEGVHGFAEAEMAEMRLKAALESSGADVNKTTEDFKAFAAQLQATRVIEDDQVLSMLSMATTYGLTAEQAKNAVKNAQAMAAVKGGSAENYLRGTAFLEQGTLTRELQRLTPKLKEAKNEAEKVAIANEWMAKAQKTAEEETRTWSGAWRMMKISVGNALEEIGKVIVETFKPVIGWIQRATDWFQALSEPIKQVISKIIIVGTVVAAAAAAWGVWGGAITSILSIMVSVVSTFGLWAVAIAAVVYGIYNLISSSQIWQTFIDGVREAWQWVQDFFDDFEVNMEKAGAIVLIIWGEVVEFTSACWDGIVFIVEGAVNGLLEFIAMIFPATQGMWSSVSDGAASAWNVAWAAISDFFMSTLGFFANFRSNMSALWNWFRDNWKNILADVWTLIVMTFKGIPDIVIWAFETQQRIMNTFAGWLYGRFKSLFSYEVLDAILTGLIKIGETIRGWAAAAWETIKGIFTGKGLDNSIEEWTTQQQTAIAQAKSDFEKGMEGGFGTVLDAAKEQFDKFPNPYEKFEATTETIPKMKTDLDRITTAIDEAMTTIDEDNAWLEWWNSFEEDAEDAGKKGGEGIAREFAKAMKFDAALANSVEAIARIQEFMETGGIGGGGGEGKGKGKGKGVGGSGALANPGGLSDAGVEGGGEWGGEGMGDVAAATSRSATLLEKIEKNTAVPPVQFESANFANV